MTLDQFESHVAPLEAPSSYQGQNDGKARSATAVGLAVLARTVKVGAETIAASIDRASASIVAAMQGPGPRDLKPEPEPAKGIES